MIDFINGILNADIPEILGDMYAPAVAAVAVSWAIIAFAGAVSVFSHLFEIILNFGGNRKW